MTELLEIGSEGAGALHPAIARASSQGWPNRMLLRMLSFISQGLCPRWATRPWRRMLLPSKPSSKPATRCNRQLCPPGGACDPHQLPGAMVRLILQHRLLLVQGGDAIQLQGPRRQAGVGEIPVLLGAVEELAQPVGNRC